MKLVWTESAILDLEKVKDFISRDSEYYALALVEKIFEAVEKLTTFPNIGREVPEYQDKTIREILCSNYRIIYQVRSNEVIILAIIHGAREINDKKPWELS
ncbi:MAG: type II toxin-antitoxin system RelE/ParE family toxin [Candidatus Syntrophonatronum acetioxidans]|uniref:Type II toxin-antitoxin system RelE/ParE family toxin n=1 Tax=Candidatus Syntrophonatronum acetioxidans TaxID=1795816 RepID=A0A424YAF0_9FIRM|nr:MAG: type II toxin-antitoxin system RelE/ParE family toxin [Candidatus Syntrophonatronum acetioxidans]